MTKNRCWVGLLITAVVGCGTAAEFESSSQTTAGAGGASSAGAGGGGAVVPPTGTGGAIDMGPYCSPIGVPSISYVSYLTEARPLPPLLADAGAAPLDGGAGDAGLNGSGDAGPGDAGPGDAGLPDLGDAAFAPDARPRSSSAEARVEIAVDMTFPWGIPFAVGPVTPLTEGVEVLGQLVSSSFQLSIPARLTSAMVSFHYLCGPQEVDLEIEIALHQDSVQARLVFYDPPF